MSRQHLYDLADAAGLARIWWTVDGAEQIVTDAALEATLGALGYPADTEAEAGRSLARLRDEESAVPRMIVAEVGEPIAVPASLLRAVVTAEDGFSRSTAVEGGYLPPIETPGYYQIEIHGQPVTLAVAPRACFGIPELGDKRFWGPAVQIPALRGKMQQPFGNFADLDDAVQLFAARGADAMMINPVHALYPGHGVGYSPYSPSSRLYLNGAMGDPGLLGLPPLPARPGGALIDWAGALPRHLADLRAIFATLDVATRLRILKEAETEGGAGLRRHAIFDALDGCFRPGGAQGWRDWPALFHDPDGREVADFAARNADEVDFHLFTQWLAARSLEKVQAGAKSAGMAIGLLADLAVGVDPSGSDSWGMREHMLDGLTIGAPPDPLGPLGQNWMLTSFSPRGLRDSGYAPWIAMLRATLGRAGGMRIDHAYGLSRLWVVPRGYASTSGAYLRYPFRDLMRLAALESHRAGALIVAEDLGTKPPGFAEAMEGNGMLGMRVLWFERAADHGFIGPQDYPALSVAMTGTHDTATVAGWWTGRDLDWAEQLGRLPEGATLASEEARRDWDRGLLWATFGAPGPQRPAPDAPDAAVTAALAHIGRAQSRLAIAPLEDFLAIEEQPNLPGTITEHPNWRRRLDAPLADLLSEPAVEARVETLAQARRTAGGE